MMKFNFSSAQSNDVVQTSATYGAFSGEKQVKQVQRAALTIITAAASVAGGLNTTPNDSWSKKVKAEFESLTIHLLNSVEGKRRTYTPADVFDAFQIGNALQIADSTLHGIKAYVTAARAYKVNNVTAAAQEIQQINSCIEFVEGLLDSFPVSPYVKDLIKITGYYPGNRNHTNTVFLIDEIGLPYERGVLDKVGTEDGMFHSRYITVDIAQETDADRLVGQIDTLMDQITSVLLNSAIREASADLIAYGKGSLKGIKCSGLGSQYDVMRKLVCNSIGGYSTEGFDHTENGTYYYDQIGVKWASLAIGYSQDHAALKDAVASVVGDSDGSGIPSTNLLGGCFGFFQLEESTSEGTVSGEFVSIVFTKWTKHLSDEGQIWVWFNDRIDFDRYNDWDEASTNLPILITNVTAGLRDGFNLSYNAGATGRQACYFSTLADAEFVYYPVRILDFAKDYIPNLVEAYLHVDTEKIRQERKNAISNKNNKPSSEKPKDNNKPKEEQAK